MKIMKLKYFVPVLALALTATSCDFLNLSDPNKVTVGNFFQTEADITNTLNGVYASFKGSYYFGRQDYLTDCYARVLQFPDAGVGGGENYAFWAHTVSNSHTFVANRWNSIYASIDKANTLIKHLDDVTYAKSTTRDTYEAEARFVRAFGHYCVVSEWGAAPLCLKKLESVSEVYEADVRVPKDKIYAAIVEDCQWVEKSPLVDLQPASLCGRACKVAAYALEGKALLQQATDPDFASQKTALCEKAITALTAAWNKKTFSKLEDISVTDAWDMATQKGSKENIFQINYVSGDANNGGSLPGFFAPENYYDETQAVCNNLTYTSSSVIIMEYKGDEIFPAADRAKDLRFKNLIGKGKRGGNDCYFTRKYTDRTTDTKYYGCDFVVFRYADVVMMLAEANYHKGDAAKAMEWLNMVRERAGLDKVSGLSGTALRDAIYQERLREFVGESKAWEDYLRGYSHDELKAYFVADGASNFTDKDFLFPIPYNQWVLNPEKLTQNPGY